MKNTLPHLLMKPLPLFLALFAVSCASKTPPVVKVEPSPGRYLSRAEADRVRLPETIKTYPLGRYADPNRRGVMHEAHTIYRVETTPDGGEPPPPSHRPQRGESFPPAPLNPCLKCHALNTLN